MQMCAVLSSGERFSVAFVLVLSIASPSHCTQTGGSPDTAFASPGTNQTSPNPPQSLTPTMSEDPRAGRPMRGSVIRSSYEECAQALDKLRMMRQAENARNNVEQNEEELKKHLNAELKKLEEARAGGRSCTRLWCLCRAKAC